MELSAPNFEPGGRRFESFRARQFLINGLCSKGVNEVVYDLSKPHDNPHFPVATLGTHFLGC